jgi:hypothetical protein
MIDSAASAPCFDVAVPLVAAAEAASPRPQVQRPSGLTVSGEVVDGGRLYSPAREIAT